MRHREKTKQELISELEGLRARVTHLERVNDALQLSEEKFRIIFENAIHEIVYLDRTGRIMEINKKESITG